MLANPTGKMRANGLKGRHIGFFNLPELNHT